VIKSIRPRFFFTLWAVHPVCWNVISVLAGRSRWFVLWLCRHLEMVQTAGTDSDGWWGAILDVFVVLTCSRRNRSITYKPQRSLDSTTAL
jgi:hypothetical protein